MKKSTQLAEIIDENGHYVTEEITVIKYNWLERFWRRMKYGPSRSSKTEVSYNGWVL